MSVDRFFGRSILAAVSVLLGLLILEGSCWLYVRYRAQSAGGALEELDAQKMTAYRKMFPDLSDRDIHSLFFTYKQTYEPWVEFRNQDLEQPLAHATGLVRKTVPESSAPGDPGLEVYFFGGSTMQGVHVPDDRTIPSQFMRQAASSADVHVHAVNFGQPYYYFKQEAILFYNLLLDGKRPRIAIFLDGLNDLHQPGSSVRRTPFFTPALRWMFEQPYTSEISDIARHTNIYKVASRTFGDLSMAQTVPTSVIYENYSVPSGETRDEAFAAIARGYVSDLQLTDSTCKANGIVCLFFLQPVPFVKYDRSGDIFAMKDAAPEYETAYAIIKTQLNGNAHFESLDDVFLAPAQPPYVDAVHYSPYGTQVLAERIYRKVHDVLTRGATDEPTGQLTRGGGGR